MSTTTPQKYRNSYYGIDIYSYNPFTDKLPSTTTGDHWKYIKYNPNNDDLQGKINFPAPTDVVGKQIWVLYAGSGGYGGFSQKKAGGGGGGGTGELKMSLLNTDNFTSIDCTIGKLNTQYSIDYDNTYANGQKTVPNGTSRNFNYNTTSATTLAIKKNNVITNTLIAQGGFAGNFKVSDNNGAEGGYGGNCMRYNGTNLVINRTTEIYDTTTITTIPFGSMGGGTGYGNGGNRSRMGDRYELFPQTGSTTIFEYRYVDETRDSLYADGNNSGTEVNFNITLSSVECDRTGTKRILTPGNGGRAADYGANSEVGFIMFFYKTNNPLTTNITSTITKSQIGNMYNYNPYTNKIPDFTGLHYKWVYYLMSGEGAFNHTLTNVYGNDVWILAGGPGGKGGAAAGNYADGCGGGGGPGEVVLAKISKNNTILKCDIGPLSYDRNNNESSGSVQYTTITNQYNNVLVKAYGGFQGHIIIPKYDGGGYGGGGGHGGGVYGSTTQNKFNTSGSISIYRFGSGYGGGGEGNGKNTKEGYGGNYVTASFKSGTEYDYKVNGNERLKTGHGVTVDFGKTLGGVLCDDTGTVGEILRGGNGGKTNKGKSTAGDNGAPGFVMIFHKTPV